MANAPARITSQWDRVSVPQPPPQVSTLDSERRITICYRYMVEQYEHLVQHYYDLSRARNTPTVYTLNLQPLFTNQFNKFKYLKLHLL